MGPTRPLALALCLLGFAPGLPSGEVVVPVSDDSWIAGLMSSTSYGDDPEMRVCPRCYQWTYLKFDLGAVTGMISEAKVRMTRISGERPEEISLYLITDDSWTEGALTGQSRPAPLDPPNVSALAMGSEEAGRDVWVSAALTDAVRTERDSDGTLSVMLREDYNTVVDLRMYYTSEGATEPDSAPALVLTIEEPADGFSRGDANSDGDVDISDAILVLLHLFVGGPDPACADAADGNDDGAVDVSDSLAILGYLFRGDPPLASPFGSCGEDPTADEIACEEPGDCG